MLCGIPHYETLRTMGQFIYLFVTIFCSLFFFNYKYSKGIRIIAFREEETPMEAICSFVMMVVIALLWAFYFVIRF
jgi:hypothetical protein